MRRTRGTRGNAAPAAVDPTVRLVLHFVKANSRHHGKVYPPVCWVDLLKAGGNNEGLTEQVFNDTFHDCWSLDALAGNAEYSCISYYERTKQKVKTNLEGSRNDKLFFVFGVGSIRYEPVPR